MSADAVYALGAVLTVLALRARILWSRPAGIVLAVVGTGLVAWLVVASPSVESPGVESPGVESPGVESPGVESPGVESPGATSLRADDEHLAALLALAASLVLCWRAVAARRGARGVGRPTAGSSARDGDATASGAALAGEAPAQGVAAHRASGHGASGHGASAEGDDHDRSSGPGARPTVHLTTAPAVVASAGMLLLVALAALVPPTGAATWPPWPLAGLHWLAVRVDSWLVVYALPALVIAGLLAAPAFDTRAPGVSPRSGLRRDEVLYFVLFFVLLGALPLAVALFTPAAAPPARAPLGTRVWLDLLGAPLPSTWPVREAPGLLLCGLLVVGLPLVLPRWRATQGLVERHLKRLGTIRFVLFLWLAVGLLYVPLRVVLGWALGIGPLLHLPELGIAL